MTPTDAPPCSVRRIRVLSETFRLAHIADHCTFCLVQQFIGCNGKHQEYLRDLASRDETRSDAFSPLCAAIIYYAPTIFAQLGLDPNTSSLLATGVYGITNTVRSLPPRICHSASFADLKCTRQVFTLPAVFFIDHIGRRKLLLCGAVGCGISLVIIGAIVAAFAGHWKEHAGAGKAAICESAPVLAHLRESVLTRSSSLQSLFVRLSRCGIVFAGAQTDLPIHSRQTSTTSTSPTRGLPSDGASALSRSHRRQPLLPTRLTQTCSVCRVLPSEIFNLSTRSTAVSITTSTTWMSNL